jgi:hypothetical protein
MKMICPRCEAVISRADDFQGSFRCPQCEFVCYATELLYETDSIDPDAKLAGTWLTNSDGRATVGASAKSWLAPLPISIALALLTFSVWMVLDSYAEDPKLVWFTGPFGAVLSLIALYLLWKGALFIAGRVEVCIEGDDATIFTGVGKIGRTRRFKVSQMWYVRRKRDFVNTRHGAAFKLNTLVINGSFNAIEFAGILDEDRRSFLHAALVRLLPTREQ